MSEVASENAESFNEDFKNHNNIQYRRSRGRRANTNKDNPNDSSNRNVADSEEHPEEEIESYRRSFGKPFIDKIEDKIAYLSCNPTNELPPLDVSGKKFTGRNRIYVSNIDDSFTEEDIINLFKPYGETSDVFINKVKHFAFVKMDYHYNAQKAQRELDGVSVKNRNLKMKISPACTAVKVKNLSPYVTNELLHYAFSVFGEIENAIVLVDEKGRSTCEGIIDFVRKNCALTAIQKCREKCYFLTNSLKPAVVEHYDIIDQTVGLLDKHFNARNVDFHQERSTGPRIADFGSFDHEYGSRWKSLYELHVQKEEALKKEFRLECEKLEAQMEYARFEHETEALRKELRAREMDKERQKREWEAKERQVEEERLRAEARVRQAQERINSRYLRQDDMTRRRDEERDLLLHAQNLTSILDTQEHSEYEVPTSSTREMSVGHFSERDSFGSSKNSLLGSYTGSENLEPSWNKPANNEGHWVREDVREIGNLQKKRRH